VSALARETSTIRLGTLVTSSALMAAVRSPPHTGAELVRCEAHRRAPILRSMPERLHMRAGLHGGAEARLVADNQALAERLQGLAPVLTSMVHDLAAVRRENAALRRENLRLQALLAGPVSVVEARADRVESR